MISLFFQHRYYMAAILFLILLSILCQITLGVIYHRLIRETENMSATKNKSLQQLKLRFSGCSRINDGISNVPVFVDRFLNQLHAGIFSLSFLRHLSGQLMLLAVLVAGIGACHSIAADETIFQISPFYLICFAGLYCYFSLSSLIDIPGKTKMLQTNLIDYLENHLSNQVEQALEDMQKLSQGQQDASAQSEKENAPAFSRSEAEELEVLLKEFLA